MHYGNYNLYRSEIYDNNNIKDRREEMKVCCYNVFILYVEYCKFS